MTDEEAVLLLKEKISSTEKTKFDNRPTKKDADEERMTEEPLWNDRFEPSDKEVHTLMRTRMTEAKEETNSIILYDTITKTKISYSDFKKNYNEKYAKIYLKYKELNERVPEEVSKNFWKEFGKPTKQIKSAIVEKEIVPVNDKIFDEPIEDNDKSFIQLFKSMTGDDELLRIMRNCMTLYLYLAGNIQRKPRENDSFNVYENYYKKGILAFAETETVISRRTGISRRCITRYVNHMKDNGIIEIDKKIRTTQEGTKEHNIYILGTVNGKGNYNLFINKKCWKTPHNILDRK